MFGQSSWESKILGANPIKLEYKSNEISFFLNISRRHKAKEKRLMVMTEIGFKNIYTVSSMIWQLHYIDSSGSLSCKFFPCRLHLLTEKGDRNESGWFTSLENIHVFFCHFELTGSYVVTMMSALVLVAHFKLLWQSFFMWWLRRYQASYPVLEQVLLQWEITFVTFWLLTWKKASNLNGKNLFLEEQTYFTSWIDLIAKGEKYYKLLPLRV